jgi:nucleotide-binding universal stress UspA family protein
MESEERKEMPASIICGVDGSPDSREALRIAGRLGAQLGLRLIVAHVVPPQPRADVSAAAPGAVTAATSSVQAPSVRMLEQMMRDVGVVRAERRVEYGLPPERLADLADEERAEVIVVGSRGRGRLAAAFLGSVSSDLIGLARCPVLVVPRGARASTCGDGVDASEEAPASV